MAQDKDGMVNNPNLSWERGAVRVENNIQLKLINLIRAVAQLNCFFLLQVDDFKIHIYNVLTENKCFYVYLLYISN